MFDAETFAEKVFGAVEVYVSKRVSALERQVAELSGRLAATPVPKDGAEGRDGRDGVDGKSVTPDEVRSLVGQMAPELVKLIPVPKDGAPGAAGRDGKDGVPGSDGKDGAPGAPGMVDLDVLKSMVDLAVAVAVAAIPKPRDGIDGKDGRDGKDGEPGARGTDGRDGADGANGKDGADGINGKDGASGRDGVDGKSIDPEEVRAVVDDLVREHVALIPKAVDGVDGKDGTPGRDGRDGQPGPAGASGAAGEKGLDGKDGRDGYDGFSPDDLELDVRDERTVVVRMRSGERVIEREVRLAIPIDRGVYKSGRAYEKGDVVTYGGSAFIAQCDTKASIGGATPSPDWRLMVKRGQDARGPDA